MVWQRQYEGIAGGMNPVVCLHTPQGRGCCWGAQDCHSCSGWTPPRSSRQQCPHGMVAVLHGWSRYEAALLTGNLLRPPVSSNALLRLRNAPSPLPSPGLRVLDMLASAYCTLPRLRFHRVLEIFYSPLLSPRQISTRFISGRKARI